MHNVGEGEGGSKQGVLWKMRKWRILKILTEEWGFQNTNSQKNKLESLSIVICRTGGINQDIVYLQGLQKYQSKQKTKIIRDFYC